jgi:DUF218 domain-containing protein
MTRRRRRKTISLRLLLWMGLLLAVLLAGLFVWKGLYPFLARQAPVRSEVLVIEGWLPDELLGQAMTWAGTHGVTTIYTTGGPLATGSYLVEWKTYAEMTRARLKALGMDERYQLIAVPAEKVRRGRTRESARALQDATALTRGEFNLISQGPHTRRSWRAFQAAFGDGVEVGSVALTPMAYDGRDWWSCSEGVRGVIGETIAIFVDLWPGGRGGEENAAPDRPKE